MTEALIEFPYAFKAGQDQPVKPRRATKKQADVDAGQPVPALVKQASVAVTREPVTNAAARKSKHHPLPAHVHRLPYPTVPSPGADPESSLAASRPKPPVKRVRKAPNDLSVKPDAPGVTLALPICASFCRRTRRAFL